MINNHNFMGIEGYEADDLVLSYEHQNPQFDCIKVSPDKDILNLCGVNFNPRKMEIKQTSLEEEQEFFWKSMICGDTVDGIKGIPKWGEKSFNLIKETLPFGTSKMNNAYYRETILHCYCNVFGEYEGIKEFYKNYRSLKIINNAILTDVKLNKVTSD